jgi:hypothetical protein
MERSWGGGLRRSRRGRRCFNGGRIINWRQLSRPRPRPAGEKATRNGKGPRGASREVGVGPVPARARQRQRPSAPPVHDDAPGDGEPALPFCGDPLPLPGLASRAVSSLLAGLVSPVAFMYVRVNPELDATVLSTGVYTVLRYISVTLYSLYTVVECIETHNTNTSPVSDH